MRIPDPKANTTTEAYLAYKAGYLEESELKPVLYEPYLHFDGWLAYWAGLVPTYPVKDIGKNLLSTKMATSTPRKGNPQRDRFVITCEDDRIDWVCNVAEFPTGNGGGIVFEGLKVKKGKTYTLSFTLDSARPMGNIRLANNDNFDSGVQSLYIGNQTTVVGPDLKYTFTANNDWSQLRLYIWSSVASPGVSNTGAVINPQLELGSDKTTYETFSGKPEMLCDEEALVAYLSGVTDTYPEEIKDPYDVRIVGYLKYLVSARWGRPEYPVNNEEFYLSTMKPPVVPSGDTPSSDIEMDDTAEAPFIDLKMYGDTSQQTYSGKNLFNVYDIGGTSTGDNRVSYTVENEELTVTQVGTKGNGYVWVKLDKDKLLGKELTLSVGKATSYGGSNGPRIRFTDQNGASISGVSFTFYPDDETSETFSVPSELPSGVTELRLYIYENKSNITGQKGATSKYTKLQIEVGDSVTSYEPYVGGEPAPNPDYPQNVQTVTGEQIVTVTGKNLFPTVSQTSSSTGITFARNSDGTYTISGTATSEFNAIFWVDDLSIFANGQTYTLSSSKQVGDLLVLVEPYNGSTWLRSFPRPSDTNLSRTSSFDLTNATRVKFSLRVQKGKTVDLTNLAVQFEKGAATDFVPYRNQSYTINLGKNILNNNSPDLVAGTATWTPTDTGGRISNSVTWGDGVQWRFKDLSVGGKYTFHAEVGATKCYVYVRTYTDGSFSTVKTRLVSDATGDVTRTITLDSPYVGISLLNNIPMDNVEIKNFQFELGDAFTGYAPYFEPIELCKIGDYQDYIYCDRGGDWFIHKEIGKIVFDNNTNWDKHSTTDGNVFRLWSTGLVGYGYNTGTKAPALMDTDICIALGSQPDSAYGVFGVMGSQQLRLFRGEYDAEYTAEKLKSEMVGHYVCGALVTPIDTEITDSLLLSQLNALFEGGSYEGKTCIKVTATNPDLPGLLYVEAGKNV